MNFSEENLSDNPCEADLNKGSVGDFYFISMRIEHTTAITDSEIK